MVKTIFKKDKADYTLGTLWKDFERLRSEGYRQDDEILRLESKIRAYEFFLKSIGQGAIVQ